MPSLHINKDDFSNIIGELLDIQDKAKLEGLVNDIFRRAKPYSLSSRNVTVTTEFMEKKAKRMLSSSRLDADLVANYIHIYRRRMKHTGIRLIQPTEKDWGLVKQIAAHALDFSNEFKLTRKKGFKKYVEIGLKKMNKFGLTKFLGMYEGICLTYEAVLEIEKDDDKEMTYDMYKTYSRKVIEQTGLHDRLEELPDKYVWFVRARKEAEKMNLSVKVYMNAQFQGLDFTKGIPHPTQLVGPKATERVIRYCYERGIKVNK